MLGFISVLVGASILVYGLFLFIRGIYYLNSAKRFYKTAQKHQEELLEQEKDFNEFQKYKEEIGLK